MTYSESRFIVLLFLVVPFNIHTTPNTATNFFPKKKLGRFDCCPVDVFNPGSHPYSPERDRTTNLTDLTALVSTHVQLRQRFLDYTDLPLGATV